jgi:hypothetical protein
MADGHPAEKLLRSYSDGELGWLAARRCARHLKGCRACRVALEEQDRLDRHAADLLARLDLHVDTGEGWRRLRALSGGRQGPQPRLRLRPAMWFAGAAMVLAVLGILAKLHVLEKGAGSVGAEPGVRIQDLCCWDLDGGGPGDDGVLTVTLTGERVVALTLYEDGNRSGGLTTLDPIRYGSMQAILASSGDEGTELPRGVAQEPVIVRDFCCADYDGGGPADDGVFTLNRAGEVVESVVLYEDSDRSRSFSAADRVRWSTARPGQ